MRTIALIFSLCAFTLLNAGEATIDYMIGEVRVKQSGTAGWEDASLNLILQEKDVIRTGNEAVCELQLQDGTVSRIFENSIMELRDLPETDKEDGDLFSGLGRFFFKIKKQVERSFKVSGPVAVAAVRGTEFLLINDAEASKVMVRRGEIIFSDVREQNVVTVGAGQKSALRMGEEPEEPQPLSEEDQAMLEEASKSKLDGPTEELHEEEQPGEVPPQPEPQEAPEKPSPDRTGEPGELDKEKTKEEGKTGKAIRGGIAIGAVTINDQIYNQIGIRPEFSFGKLGIALDLSLYIDKDGNIREENWDEPRDIFEKVYYVRWGQRGDPFYVKAGAIDNYRLGFGILMNHYANTVEYPDVIRTGAEFGWRSGKIGFDGMINNFSELSDGGGLMAGRVSYDWIGNLQVGASAVYDRNQYKALNDDDGDGVPDFLDAFPGDENYAVDSDGDNRPDATDYDRDGNGFTDNIDYLLATGYDSSYVNDDAFRQLINNPAAWERMYLAPDPFNIDKADDKSQLAFALDVSYPLLNFEYLNLIAYSQWAKFPYNGGWGATAPGLRAKFAFINAFAEYRMFGKRFLPEYFNETYELERATAAAVANSDTTTVLRPRAKRDRLEHIAERMRGYVAGADFNLFNFAIFGAEYQHMSRSDFTLKTFRSNLDINTDFVPKINRAGAYYVQNQADDLFKKTEGTILGYRVEYEISSGAALLLDFRQTYRDRNGDGKISGPEETIRTTNIQTVIRF